MLHIFDELQKFLVHYMMENSYTEFRTSEYYRPVKGMNTKNDKKKNHHTHKYKIFKIYYINNK